MNYGISFDFWNTLFANGDEDQRQNLRLNYFHKILSTYEQISRPTIEEAFHASKVMFMDEWTNKQRTPDAAERVLFMCEHIGVKINDEDLLKTADYFGEVIRYVPPIKIPLINDLIPKLASKYPLGIISDTGYIRGDYIRSFLAEEHLLNHFQSQFFSDEHEYCKPHSSAFHLTCLNLNIDRTKLIHIGDLENTDVKGIKNVGGISIKFTGTSDICDSNSETDYIVNDYKELPLILKRITGDQTPGLF